MLILRPTPAAKKQLFARCFLRREEWLAIRGDSSGRSGLRPPKDKLPAILVLKSRKPCHPTRIGQSDLKKTLRLMLDSALQCSATLEHVVCYGGRMSREDPIGGNHRRRAGYQPLLEMVSTTPLV